MSHKSSVLYANKPDAKFDMEYYLKTHMPLVQEKWKPYGLKSWEITRYEVGLEGKRPDFLVQAVLTWETADGAKKATSSDAAKTVFGDIPNFTDIFPTYIGGEKVGASD